MIIRFRAAATIAAVFLTLPLVASAQATLLPNASLAGDDPDGTLSAFGDAYGVAADTWEDWLFVGAVREATLRGGFEVTDGAVYAYRNVGGAWVLQQKITRTGSSEPARGIGDRLGGGIAAAGGWLFIAAANSQDFPAGLVDPQQGAFGSPDSFEFAGQVHVYQYNGSSWDFVQTLSAPEPRSYGGYGARSQATHIALDSMGKVAVIGETNILGIGALHTYRLFQGQWVYMQQIDPPAGTDYFGDKLVFASDKYLLAAAEDASDDPLTVQGSVLVYQSIGVSGRFFDTPEQTIAGPVATPADCPSGNTFGRAGLDAGGGVVAVANPCGGAVPLAGEVSIYRLQEGAGPLVFEQVVEGEVANAAAGADTFFSRNSVAVNDAGDRILVGVPLAPNGFFGPDAIGDDVIVIADSGGVWAVESTLDTPTPDSAIFRSFGDRVFFIDDDTALVREGNFLDPIISGLKSQGLIYDLTP
jgi:hypothetical protein